jgi:hypothetical protein
MFNNDYGLNRRLKARFVGIDIATGGGEGHDFSALAVIDHFEEKIKINDFPEEFTTRELFMITDLVRTRELNLDLQIEWLRQIIEKQGDPKPIVSVDASRELGSTLNLRTALPEHIVNAVVWTGGARIEKDGSRKYNASKTAAWRGVKGMISLGWLSVAPGPLRDEIVKEIRNLVLDESETGECRVKTSGTGHDDLAASLAVGMIPLLHRNILERRPARAIPSILNFSELVK